MWVTYDIILFDTVEAGGLVGDRLCDLDDCRGRGRRGCRLEECELHGGLCHVRRGPDDLVRWNFANAMSRLFLQGIGTVTR